MPLGRNDKILAHLTRQMKILEIGPSYSPVIRRGEGWNVFSLDHMDAEGLRQKYAYDPVHNLSNIEEVDFVWREGPFDSAITEQHKASFDAIIGSHVIEHFPDLLGFLLAASRVLKPRGILSLVVPDKRFCFDFFQPLALTGDILQAHAEQRNRHTPKAAFNGFAYPIKSGGKMAWGPGHTETLGFVFPNSLQEGQKVYDSQCDPSSPYLDVHGWYFTPSSFRLICLELNALGLLPFEEIGFFSTTEGCEFFVTLKKNEKPDTADLDERRMGLLKAMLIEIREQTDFLIEGSNYLGRRSVQFR